MYICIEIQELHRKGILQSKLWTRVSSSNLPNCREILEVSMGSLMAALYPNLQFSPPSTTSGPPRPPPTPSTSTTTPPSNWTIARLKCTLYYYMYFATHYSYWNVINLFVLRLLLRARSNQKLMLFCASITVYPGFFSFAFHLVVTESFELNFRVWYYNNGYQKDFQIYTSLFPRSRHQYVRQFSKKLCHEWSSQPLVVLATTRCN